MPARSLIYRADLPPTVAAAYCSAAALLAGLQLDKLRRELRVKQTSKKTLACSPWAGLSNTKKKPAADVMQTEAGGVSQETEADHGTTAGGVQKFWALGNHWLVSEATRKTASAFLLCFERMPGRLLVDGQELDQFLLPHILQWLPWQTGATVATVTALPLKRRRQPPRWFMFEEFEQGRRARPTERELRANLKSHQQALRRAETHVQQLTSNVSKLQVKLAYSQRKERRLSLENGRLPSEGEKVESAHLLLQWERGL